MPSLFQVFAGWAVQHATCDMQNVTRDMQQARKECYKRQGGSRAGAQRISRQDVQPATPGPAIGKYPLYLTLGNAQVHFQAELYCPLGQTSHGIFKDRIQLQWGF